MGATSGVLDCAQEMPLTLSIRRRFQSNYRRLQGVAIKSLAIFADKSLFPIPQGTPGS